MGNTNTLGDAVKQLKPERKPVKIEEANQGGIGYDNPRENIDPNIIGKAVSIQELNSSEGVISGQLIVGVGTASIPQLILNGGSGGADLIRLNRTAGATLSYGWSLAGNKLSFANVTQAKTTLQTTWGVTTANTAEVNIGFDYGSSTNQVGDNALIKGSDSGGAGADDEGGNLRIASGRGTGAAASSYLSLEVPNPTASGTTRQTSTEIVRVTISGMAIGASGTPYDLLVNGVIACSGALIISNATMINTNTAFTNGAGVGAGTLTNAPAAGNPTKWIPINDNGTTRYIPAW